MKKLLIIYWNKNTGPEVIIQYPPEKDSPPKDLLLKIWTKHELEKESNMIKIIPESDNDKFISTIQKYEGENYFLVLIYDKNDVSDDILNDNPEVLANIGKNLIQLINTNKITRAISEAFNTIKNFSKLDKEENLFNFFKDKIKYTILKVLRDGAITKNKLKNILREVYGFSTINIDLILMSFIRENLIVKKDIPGSNDCYFLIQDLSCLRLPPENIDKMFNNLDKENSTSLKQGFFKELINFYNDNDFSEENSLHTILSYLRDQNVYNLIRELRGRSLTVNDVINLLNNNEGLFNELLEKKFIYEIKGSVLLLTDVRFLKFTPEYIIKRLITRYKKEQISLDEYLFHLKLILRNQIEYGALNYKVI